MNLKIHFFTGITAFEAEVFYIVLKESIKKQVNGI
jgi:hypothetical protein